MLWRILITVEDIKWCGGCSILWEDILSTVQKGVQFFGGMPSSIIEEVQIDLSRVS